MAGQLIPPPELAPSLPPGLTSTQRIEVWLDLLHTCEQFLLAGLRHKVGQKGDERAAYQEWYNKYLQEHDQTMQRMVEEFNRRSEADGRPRGS